VAASLAAVSDGHSRVSLLIPRQWGLSQLRHSGTKLYNVTVTLLVLQVLLERQNVRHQGRRLTEPRYPCQLAFYGDVDSPFQFVLHAVHAS